MLKAECRDLERQYDPESVFETSTQRAPTHLRTSNSKQTAFSERGIARLFGAWRAVPLLLVQSEAHRVWMA